jgi:hypothetical protein
MGSRQLIKQDMPLQDRLAAWAKKVREEANLLPSGPERDELLAKARQADAAGSLDWATSPKSQSAAS